MSFICDKCGDEIFQLGTHACYPINTEMSMSDGSIEWESIENLRKENAELKNCIKWMMETASDGWADERGNVRNFEDLPDSPEKKRIEEIVKE